jgi:cellulose synthase (UDP-forming)
MPEQSFFAVTVIAFNLIYIIWRIEYTIPTTSKIGMTFGIALILSELLGFFNPPYTAYCFISRTNPRK